MRRVTVSRGRAVRVALGVLGAFLMLLVLAQIFLPGIAAQKVRERVGRYGTVQSASVQAFPAIELLWEKADSATVKVKSLRVTEVQAAQLLSTTRGVHDMDMHVEAMHVGPLTVSNVSVHKRGGALSAQAEMSGAQLRAALPEGLEVQPIASGGGRVQVKASGGLFGIRASVNAQVEAREGKLVAQPEGFLVGLTRLTLFSDPRVVVLGVGLSDLGDPQGDAAAEGEALYQVRLRARLP